jgi:hypothetical protein
MINNARAEDDTKMARSGDVLHRDTTSDYGDEREKMASVPLADYDIRSRRVIAHEAKGEHLRMIGSSTG